MVDDWRVPLSGGRVARVRFTRRAGGDLSARLVDHHLLAERRRAVIDLPWYSVLQVHGSTVRSVDATTDGDPSQTETPEADALVTRSERVVLSINTADCAPVALVGRRGAIGAVHAGWKGLAAGVVGQTVGAMRRLGAGPITAYLGPCVYPECYEFGEDDLDRLAVRFGPGIRGRSSGGTPALDLPAAVARALGDAGVPLVHASEVCTACAESTCFSHRARAEPQRHALAVWIDDETSGG